MRSVGSIIAFVIVLVLGGAMVLFLLSGCAPSTTPPGLVTEPPFVDCPPTPPEAPFPVRVYELKARELALVNALATCRQRVQQMGRDWPRVHLPHR